MNDIDRWIHDVDRLCDNPGDWTGEAWQDEQPAPEPAAPSYDVDLPDSEWDGVKVVSVAMALDVLRSGRTLMAHCGPLQVTLEPFPADSPIVADVLCNVWNTVTCASVSAAMGFAQVGNYLNAYGHVAAGDWFAHCPDEPDGAPQY